MPPPRLPGCTTFMYAPCPTHPPFFCFDSTRSLHGTLVSTQLTPSVRKDASVPAAYLLHTLSVDVPAF